MCCAGCPEMSLPSSNNCPRVGAMSPLITRNVVVLPAPFAPTSATRSPGMIDIEMPCSARIGPYPASTSLS